MLKRSIFCEHFSEISEKKCQGVRKQKSDTVFENGSNINSTYFTLETKLFNCLKLKKRSKDQFKKNGNKILRS